MQAFIVIFVCTVLGCVVAELPPGGIVEWNCMIEANLTTIPQGPIQNRTELNCFHGCVVRELGGIDEMKDSFKPIMAERPELSKCIDIDTTDVCEWADEFYNCVYTSW